MCTAVDEDGNPCLCADTEPKSKKGKCRKCGHSVSKHTSPITQAHTLSLQPPPSTQPRRTVSDIVDAYTTNNKEFLATNKQARQEATAGFRPIASGSTFRSASGSSVPSKAHRAASGSGRRTAGKTEKVSYHYHFSQYLYYACLQFIRRSGRPA